MIIYRYVSSQYTIYKPNRKNILIYSIHIQIFLIPVNNEEKQKIDERFHPDGYNIGINVNEAAGQSVFHVHMHIIPRYKGDVPNPKGGVRGVIPGKQSYNVLPEKECVSPVGGTQNSKSYTLEHKRKEHGNAYLPCDYEADRLLCRMYDEGKSISLLSDIFERTKEAIRSRLKKLGKIQ